MELIFVEEKKNFVIIVYRFAFISRVSVIYFGDSLKFQSLLNGLFYHNK